MPSILIDLYRGNYSAAGRSYEDSSEYMKVFSCMSVLEDEIERALTGDLKEKFAEYIKLSGELSRVGGEEDFAEGFRLGVNLMTEALRTE